MKPFEAEMKNPVCNSCWKPSVGERSVRPILEYRFDTNVYSTQ